MSEIIYMPEKLIPVFRGQADVRGARGGRGSGKTRTFAKMSAVNGMRFGQAGITGQIVCGRQFMNSLEDSSLEEVKRAIAEEPALARYYEVGEKYVKSRDGRIRYTFVGLDRSIASVKSKSRILILWADEAEPVSGDTWDIVVPTLREENGDWNAELWVTWNPDQEDAAVETRFAQADDPLIKIATINYCDNKKFPAKLERERLRDQQLRPGQYGHIWNGDFRSAAGLMFKRAWFSFYDVLPSHLNYYMASDYAVTPDGGDFTEHGVFGLTETGDLYVVDWWYGQTDPAEWIDKWLGLGAKYSPLACFEEAGVILRAVTGAIDRRMRETGTFLNRVSLPSAGSKAERALGFAARASAGTVYLPKGEMGIRILNQLCAFNGEDGRQDDAVDVCSLVGRGIALMAGGSPLASTGERQVGRDYGIYDEDEDDDRNWKVA